MNRAVFAMAHAVLADMARARAAGEEDEPATVAEEIKRILNGGAATAASSS